MASDDDNTPDQPLVVPDEHQNESQVTSNMSNPISGALENASLDRDEKKNNEKEEEDIDIDSELARMMAIQEEEQQQQQEEQNVSEVGQDEHDIEFDPNIAIIGNIDDDFQYDNDLIAVADDNNDNAAAAANNPAAIALRQRQALQNQRRQDQLNALANQPFLTRQLLKILRPLCRYTPLSILAALLLLHHTLRTRQQFYLAVVYIQSSKLSYIIFGNAIIAMAVSTFSLVTKLFLDGGLRPNERDAIGENIRWDVTETCLALTIFRSELDVVTAVLFLGLVVVKCLHWSAELRGSHLRMTEEVFIYPDDEEENLGGNTDEASNAQARMNKKSWYQRLPRVRMTHVRYLMFLWTLLTIDLLAVAHCALSVATDGPSVQILFGFEFAIMLISASSAIMSYILHVIDGFIGFLHHWVEGEHHHCPVGGMAEPNANEGGANMNAVEEEANAAQTQRQQQEQQQPKSFAGVLLKHLANPWRDQRATFSFVIELVAQAAKFLFYVVFFAIVFTYYGMPINIFREVYVSFQQLRRRLIAFNNYRRLTNNMEKRFESVTDQEELDRLGHTCIICRDQMDLLGGCKKLPGCGHAFHTHCLREWLVQQQTCPTCRADIAANEARMKKEKEKEEAAAAAAATTATEETPPTTTAGQGEGGETVANNMAPDQTQGQGLLTSSSSETVERPASSDELPSGWTEHVDGISGRKYYFNSDLNKSTWEKPKKKLSFPCLYRVTSPAGVLPAETFENVDGTAVVPNETRNAIRSIPVGKIIVCTSEVYEELLRIPDGYVMGCDVERLFELTTSI
mmetsp:Transcript_13932/g.22812  ORF Transcript_13932/g.22812 Transcript_13932/m.22812 type:complete len:798 (+) Transcript_13932:27-2420(+)